MILSFLDGIVSRTPLLYNQHSRYDHGAYLRWVMFRVCAVERFCHGYVRKDLPASLPTLAAEKQGEDGEIRNRVEDPKQIGSVEPKSP